MSAVDRAGFAAEDFVTNPAAEKPAQTGTVGRRFAMALLVFALPAIQLAQTTGDIDGRVVDAAGTPLSGVKVEATGPSLPGVRSSTTDRDGLYRLPGVPPGAYRVIGSLPQFRPVERTCTVSLGSTATVDLVLPLETEVQIVVSGETPPIDQTTTTTGTNYTSEVISRLPVDRNYAEIVRANPGVSIDQGETQGRLLALAIYGATSAENQWVVDGVNTTNVLKGIQGKALSTEFVEEVEVKTGGYQAELGRALGGVINVVTKSGGNVFHGDGFVYYDSSNTVAETRSEPEDADAARTNDSKRLDYGAGLGGYLLKDRLWFYGAFNQVTLERRVSPLNFSESASNDELFPVDQTENLYSAKLTWNATASTTVVGSVFADPSSTSGAVLGAIANSDPAIWYATREQGGTDYGLRLTQLFGPQALATLQGGHHRDEYSLVAADTIRYTDLTCVGGTPESRCTPQINAVWGGVGQGTGRGKGSRQQYAASLNQYVGHHELKAGGDYQDGQSESTRLYTGGQFVRILNEYGQTYYEHRYFAVSRRDLTPVPVPTWKSHVLDYGAYVQDTWRAAPGLTLNAGLRWDGQTTRNYLGETFLQFDDAWQPRAGVVWDPWRDGKTKIYASVGRFSYALPLAATAGSFGNATTIRVYNFDPVSLVQDPNVFRHETPLAFGGSFFSAADEDLKTAYQDELTLGIERMLGPSLTLGLKGTYRRLGRAIEDRWDLDYNSPETGYNQHALINPGSDARFASGDVPVCNGLFDDPGWYQCSPTGPATPEAKRLYRGIEVLARHSPSDRLWLQASYVYSSLRGNYDGGVNQVYGQFLGQTAPGGDYDFDYPPFQNEGYGALTLDRPHRFRFDGSWVTPLNLSVGIQTWVESGAPLNRMGFFNSNYGSIVFLVPRGSAGRLPTLWDANLTLAYPIAIGPLTATLQAYVFNLFNNQIVTSQDQAWTIFPPSGFPDNIYDPNQEQNNENYGRVIGRSSPRRFRVAIRVSF